MSDGTPLNRIVVAGHGQGGCIAVHVGLRLNEQLAGVIVFSALLLPERVHKHEKSQVRADAPCRRVLFGFGLGLGLGPYG